MAKEIVTLYIDDTSLRILITQGRKIRHCAESPLEPGLVKDCMVLKESDVVAKIQHLFKDLKISKKKVIVGVSGFGCLSRLIMLPMLPKEMLEEAVKREARRVLPLPIEQLHLLWQLVPAPEGKTQVFLIAIPRQTFDALLKVLNQAGLKTNFVSLKPLLLARLIEATRGIIIDVQTTEFDIVVMSEGIPQPFRTIAFASRELPWQEKMTVIKSELDRTIKFFNSTNSEKTLIPSVPIFASGDLANDPGACQSLSQTSGRTVLPLPLASLVESPKVFDANRYMVNISLALYKFSLKKADGATVINLNALPVNYQTKTVSLVNILALPSVIVLTCFVVSLIILIQSTSDDISRAGVHLNTIEQLYEQALPQKEELTKNITALEKKTVKVEASFRQLATALGNLEKQTTGINRGLEVTMSALDPYINLKNIRYAEDKLNIIGRAPSETELLLYVQNLNSSGRFGEMAILSMIRIQDEGFNFTLAGTPATLSTEVSAIEVIVNSLPFEISLTSVNNKGGELTVNGRATTEDEVLLYLYRLETSGRFIEVISTNATRSADGKMDFSLVLRVGE